MKSVIMWVSVLLSLAGKAVVTAMLAALLPWFVNFARLGLLEPVENMVLLPRLEEKCNGL